MAEAADGDEVLEKTDVLQMLVPVLAMKPDANDTDPDEKSNGLLSWCSPEESSARSQCKSPLKSWTILYVI